MPSWLYSNQSPERIGGPWPIAAAVDAVNGLREPEPAGMDEDKDVSSVFLCRKFFRSRLCGTIMTGSAGNPCISETWSIEPACPCCFLTAHSNGFTCANKSRRHILAPLCISIWCVIFFFFFKFLCRMSRESLTFFHCPLLPLFWMPPSYFSPSLVYHRWEWCMTRVASCFPMCAEKLIMTWCSLLCSHHTPFVPLLVGAPQAWRACTVWASVRWDCSTLSLCACDCVWERALDGDCCDGVGVSCPASPYNSTDP